MFENGTNVISTLSTNTEEEISYKLIGGKNYRLQIDYYHWSHSGTTIEPECFIYNLELAISRLTAPGLSCQANEKLPPSNLIPSISSKNTTKEFYIEKIYTYQQTDRRFLIQLPFNVTDISILFRAQVRYNFVWSDLSVRLINRQNSFFTREIFGISGYNVNDLKPVILNNGEYMLEIYEPSSINNAQLRRCNNFTLIIGYEISSSIPESQVNSLLGCKYSYPPTSLNNIAYLSVLSGYMTRFQGNFLANVNTKLDITQFNLTSTSLISIFIPIHPSIDIDILLYNGTKDHIGPLIVSHQGLVEESLYNVLSPGSYVLMFRYYPFFGKELPSSSECPNFPMELAISPIKYLDSINSLISPCTTSNIPQNIVGSTYFYGKYKRSMGTNFLQSIGLTLTKSSQLNFNLEYEFQSGGLILELQGQAHEFGLNPINVTYYAVYTYNHASLLLDLIPGNYHVKLHEMFPLQNRDSNLKCSEYAISYYLNETTDSNFCDQTEKLPTDLFSPQGGSIPYGGPQASDGSVRIHGENFYLSSENGRDHFILFKVPVPSFIRAFAQGFNNDDIDFYFYSNQNRSLGSLIDSSIGIDKVESKLLKLNSQINPYLLDVYFYSINQEQQCPTFHFEYAQKPVSVIETELACPLVLPNPEVPLPRYEINGDFWVADEFIFTKERIDSNTHNGIFTYSITLVLNSNTTLISAIDFDFLANDFRLQLVDETGHLIVIGEMYAAENSEYYNFESIFYVELPKGIYILRIREDLNNKDFGFTEYCHRFSFFMAAFTITTPSIDYIIPSMADHLNPSDDLEISIYFSEEVISPPNDNNLVSYLQNNRAIYLINHTNYIIFPTQAEFDTSQKVLTVIFSHTNFYVGSNYTLKINASKFLSINGMFVDESSIHTYQMDSCNCNNHGHCINSQTLICNCDAGYDGPHCDKCAQGYHQVATECKKNIKCNSTICNNHGKCDDSRGFPICQCDNGYATQGDDWCHICASGFTGIWPNCTISDDSQRNIRCKAPLLPTNLDIYAYLGYNGEVHLQNKYYVDVDNHVHEMRFSLLEDSVFRAYTEPHWLDIDMWLFALTDSGEISHIIAYAIQVGTEETIFTVLPGRSGNHPLKYLLKFYYYNWEIRNPNCETFNFELAISPAKRVNEEANKIKMDCKPSNFLPTPPNLNSNTFSSISNDYTYEPNTIFTVRAGGVLLNQSNYFYKVNFEIHSPNNKAALLYSEIGYRFLPGDLALLLEAGNKQSHCGKDGGYASSCISGSNTINRNILKEFLPSGNYTLWIYEPKPQNINLTTCSLFDFKMKIKFLDIQKDDEFYCKGIKFPKSLNSNGYINQGGYVHIQDFFFIQETEIPFSISTPSVMRIHGSTEMNINIQFQIRNNLTGQIIKSSFFSSHPELFTELAQGKYILAITSSMIETNVCPVMSMELVIAPNVQLSYYCPGNELLPYLPNLRVPYSFGKINSSNPIPKSFYAYTNNRVIEEWSFTPDQTAFLDVSLTNYFLTAGLELLLEFSDNRGVNVIKLGNQVYNQNYLREGINAGTTYTLKIIRPDSFLNSLEPITFPPCAEFNFELNLFSIDQVNQNPCLLEGESVPTTFNSIRFLKMNNNFDFQSNRFRVPDLQDINFATEFISFNVTTNSIFRVYTEPHVIDIDLILYENNNMVADGGFGYNNEESIVYLLLPNRQYKLQLNYFKWSENIPACPTFNMEVAIEPVHPLTRECPRSGSDHWPSPPIYKGEQDFFYSSLDIGENLYYQQKANELRTSPPIVIQLNNNRVNLHAELGYDFVTSDLMIKLVDVNSKEEWYGYNTLNGNILNIIGLSSNSLYHLYIYEVVKNLNQYMGCSYFTFELHIKYDNRDQLADNYLELPATLDSIPYLFYDGKTHFQGLYKLFDGINEQSIKFSIREPSLLRISTQHFENQLEDIQINIITSNNNQVYASGMKNILEFLSVSESYIITFRRPLGQNNDLSSVITDIELAITPINIINNDLRSHSPISSCSSPTIPPISINSRLKFYRYHMDQLYIPFINLERQSIIQNIPVNLQKDAVLYIQVGFNFLLSDMEIEITGTSSLNEKIKINGRIGKNINEIDDILPSGNYNIQIKQPILFMQTNLFSHCNIYSLYIFAQDQSQEKFHVDCSSLDILPWNLNSIDGGSAPFGGPIDNVGSLYLFGSNFLMPPSASQFDTILFNISFTSLMSIITKYDNGGKIDFSIQRGTTMKLITLPLVSSNDFYKHMEIYLLDSSKTSKFTSYELELHYQLPIMRTSCPSYSLQIIMQPLFIITQLLTCPNIINPILPPQKIIVPNTGEYSFYTSSYFTKQIMDQYTDMSTQTFKYEIQLNITKNSFITINMAYNSLVNMFSIFLLKLNRFGDKVEIASSDWEISKISRGNENLNQALFGTLLPGSYYIQITEPIIQNPELISIINRCHPFIFDLQIVPNNGSILVSSVKPANGDYLSPTNNIQLEISFSQPVNFSEEQVKNAFYLEDNNSKSNIFPSIVQKDLFDSTFWTLIFPSSSLISKRTYTLKLKKGILINNKNSVQLISINRYSTIDTSCNERGEFDNGYCFCKAGYGGYECDRCIVGYIDINKGKGPLNCTESGKCKINSCGCDPVSSSKDHCVPLGICNDTSGVVHCTCKEKNFAGQYCDECAPGYDNYQKGCPLKVPCPQSCVRGYCDYTVGKCRCPGYWTGNTCDICPTGYSGNSCLPTSSDISLGLKTLKVNYFILLI